MEILSIIISVISLFVAIRAVLYTKKQTEVSKEQLEEDKNQYILKNDVVFSIKWGTDILVPKSKRYIENKGLIGNSSFYKDKHGILEEIDDKIVTLSIKNISEINARNLIIEWQVHIPSIYSFVHEMELEFQEDDEIKKYGLKTLGKKNYKKMNSFKSKNIPAFYMGKIPIAILKIDKIYYQKEGETNYRFANHNNIKGNIEFKVQHKNVVEDINEDILSKVSKNDWKDFKKFNK
jgi:hypothetical protein